MRSDRERLLDILEAIERIDAYKGIPRSDFDSDELLQTCFVHYLQIIGEAASRLSEEMQAQHPEIPWGQMIGMRHILEHGYFEVDLDIVWRAAQVNLLHLKSRSPRFCSVWKILNSRRQGCRTRAVRGSPHRGSPRQRGRLISISLSWDRSKARPAA